MLSGHAFTPAHPVVAAGLGVRRPWGDSVRSASFRIELATGGVAPLGILMPRARTATTVVNVLAGLARPTYGELRVLGQDMGEPRGRAAARQRIGIARRRPKRPRPVRVRKLVDHAARRSGLPRADRGVLVAAILDRLALTPWADVPVRSVPDVVARRTRLAAAAVHQPDLVLLDCLLDDLSSIEATALAEAIRDVGRDSCVVAAGCDPDPLALACDEVLTLSDGILVRLASRQP